MNLHGFKTFRILFAALTLRLTKKAFRFIIRYVESSPCFPRVFVFSSLRNVFITVLLAIIKDLAWSWDISLLELDELFLVFFFFSHEYEAQSQYELTDRDFLKITF